MNLQLIKEISKIFDDHGVAISLEQALTILKALQAIADKLPKQGQ